MGPTLLSAPSPPSLLSADRHLGCSFPFPVRMTSAQKRARAFGPVRRLVRLRGSFSFHLAVPSLFPSLLFCSACALQSDRFLLWLPAIPTCSCEPTVQTAFPPPDCLSRALFRPTEAGHSLTLSDQPKLADDSAPLAASSVRQTCSGGAREACFPI